MRAVIYSTLEMTMANTILVTFTFIHIDQLSLRGHLEQPDFFFERELALLVALQGKSIWKGKRTVSR